MPDNAQLIQAVRSYARANYSRDGWDYVVECWEDADILERIQGATTEPEAIAAIAKITKLMAERRREIEAEIF